MGRTTFDECADDMVTEYHTNRRKTVENLERRLAAHESEMEKVYYPAVAPLLTLDEWRLLAELAPPP